MPSARSALAILRRAHGLRRAVSLLCLGALSLLPLQAQAPEWWSTRGVLQAGAQADDYALLNQGQLKNLAAAAVAELNEKLAPEGAGATLNTMVEAWQTNTASADDYAAANLGQLKAVAKPIYNRLISAGLATSYPWQGSTQDSDDYALANIGQAKGVFAFSVQPSTLRILPLGWLTEHGLSPTADPDDDDDDDGFSNWIEFLAGTDPGNAASKPPPPPVTFELVAQGRSVNNSYRETWGGIHGYSAFGWVDAWLDADPAGQTSDIYDSFQARYSDAWAQHPFANADASSPVWVVQGGWMANSYDQRENIDYTDGAYYNHSRHLWLNDKRVALRSSAPVSQEVTQKYLRTRETLLTPIPIPYSTTSECVEIVSFTIPAGQRLSNTVDITTPTDIDSPTGPNRWKFDYLTPIEVKLRQRFDDASPTNCRRVYSDSPKNESASNLFSLWPGEGTTIYLKGAFANTVASLPAGTVKWRGTELSPAQDTPEYHVKWTTEGFKAVVLEVAGKEFTIMFNVPDVSPRNEAESLEWVRQNRSSIVAGQVVVATSLVWTWNHQSNLIAVKKDAMRHYIWSSVLSNTFDLAVASEITGAHENYGKFINKDPAYLTAMDDYNNAIGAVSAYASGPLLGAGNTPLTPDVQIPIFEQAGLQVFAGGSLWIWWPYDANGNPKPGEEGVLRNSDGAHFLNSN